MNEIVVKCRVGDIIGDIICMPRGACRQVLKLRAAWEVSPGKAACFDGDRVFDGAHRHDFSLKNRILAFISWNFIDLIRPRIV
jgi:hypothetical protein